MPHGEARSFYWKGKNMIDIREHFKKSMLSQYYESEDSKRIPENVFLKILDYMETEWISNYEHDEEQRLKDFIPQGEPYDRERAIEYAEKRNVSIDDIVYSIACGFWLGFPIMIYEMAESKFGIPLWNTERPWADKKCYKKCPLGDCCNCHPNMIFYIGNKNYCLGQLYMNNKLHDKSTLGLPVYDDYELYCLTTPFNELHPPERTPSSIVDQLLVGFQFDYTETVPKGLFYGWMYRTYGVIAPKFRRRNNKFVGGNVIPFL